MLFVEKVLMNKDKCNSCIYFFLEFKVLDFFVLFIVIDFRFYRW